MAQHGTSRSLVLFLLGIVVSTSKLQAERIGPLSEQQLEKNITTDSRIYGGTPTSTEDFPWQLYVFYTVRDNKKNDSCGGSIISEGWSMSAAHCYGKSKDNVWAIRFYLYAGATDRNAVSSDPDVQENIINKDDFENHFFMHPEYKYNIGVKFNNDIAIFKNKKPWSLTDKVAPIALATAEDFIPGKEVTVSGWGKTCTDCGKSSILLYASGLYLISYEECIDSPTWTSSKITDKMICLNTEKTCPGDSGGPAVTGTGENNGPPYVQIGIVSFGPSGCGASDPSVFTDVADYRDWIDELMSGYGTIKCEDSDSKCSKWASRRKCRRGKYFNKCKASCACGVGRNPACVDEKSKCAKWAAMGKCSEKNVYVKCRASCACGSK